jgi:hypothetical protein
MYTLSSLDSPIQSPFAGVAQVENTKKSLYIGVNSRCLAESCGWRENRKGKPQRSRSKLKRLVQFCGNLNWKAIPRSTFEAEVHSSSLNVNAFPFRFLFTQETCVFTLLLVILFGMKRQGTFWTALCSCCFSYCLPALATSSRLF